MKLTTDTSTRRHGREKMERTLHYKTLFLFLKTISSPILAHLCPGELFSTLCAVKLNGCFCVSVLKRKGRAQRPREGLAGEGSRQRAKEPRLIPPCWNMSLTISHGTTLIPAHALLASSSYRLTLWWIRCKIKKQWKLWQEIKQVNYCMNCET